MKKVISYTHFYDLYGLLVLLSVFIIVPFGIYSSYSSYLDKKEILKQLQNESLNLDQAIKDARDVKYLEEDITPYLQSLNNAIPSTFYGEEFLNEILGLCLSTNYTVRSISFSPASPDAGYVSVNLSVEGPFSLLSRFLKSVEDSRFSILVQSFNVSFSQIEGEPIQVITINLRVYSLLQNYL